MGVDVGLATLSNELIAGGIAAYSVGFLAYAVDAAFGNHAPQLPGEKVAPVDVRVPALVGARAGGAAADPSVVEPSQSDAGSGGSFFAAHIGRFAIAVTVIGWLLQGGAIVSRGLSVHRLPWGNMYEFTLALTFTAVTAFLVIMMRQPARYLGVFVMTPVVLALGIAVLVLYVAPAPLVPALHSYWLAIHVTAAIIASGVFTVATAATTMFLVADRYATAMAAGRPVRFSALARIMPSPDVLDRTAYRAYAFAFPVWTFAVIAGAIWAEYAWGHYWQWDPKETWAFITWVIYAGYLHARATAGWRGRKAAYIAMLGFTSILFNFFIVNIFISGMHSYAGV
ncbi:MAG TPA: c-type cytochrome biogenesis protein CcsB [Acidothermaceae bacterium]